MQLADGSQSLIVESDQPVFSQADEFTCEYRIMVGAGSTSSTQIKGADEIQAVMLAFDAIRLALLDNYPSASWMGLPVELSFPRPIPCVAGIDTYKEIELLADQSLENRYR
jgi:hypothetical protein